VFFPSGTSLAAGGSPSGSKYGTAAAGGPCQLGPDDSAFTWSPGGRKRSRRWWRVQRGPHLERLRGRRRGPSHGTAMYLERPKRPDEQRSGPLDCHSPGRLSTPTASIRSRRPQARRGQAPRRRRVPFLPRATSTPAIPAVTTAVRPQPIGQAETQPMTRIPNLRSRSSSVSMKRSPGSRYGLPLLFPVHQRPARPGAWRPADGGAGRLSRTRPDAMLRPSLGTDCSVGATAWFRQRALDEPGGRWHARRPEANRHPPSGRLPVCPK
jgi:hypothetical protein